MSKKGNLIAMGMLVLAAAALFFILHRGGPKGIVTPAKDERQVQTGTASSGNTSAETSEVQPEAQQTEPEEAPTIEISPERQQLIGVKTVAVEVKPMEKVIRTVGRVEYDERNTATVNSKFEGWIEKLYVDFTGLYVKKGQPLAEFYSPELVATEQELINAVKWNRESRPTGSDTQVSGLLSKDAQAVISAARQRLRLWDITDDQIKRIEETGKVIKSLTLYSPVSGYVVQKMALLGTRVMPGEKLFDIADLSDVWIVSDIYEYEMKDIKVGDQARISLSYFPNREILSRIDYVYPVLSGETRTAKIRFTVKNPGEKLKPQMFTDVEIRLGLGKKLVIPNDAVIDTGTRSVVYVDKGDGIFEPREVQLGTRSEDFREVVQGLKAGDKVASSAAFLVDSEAQLKGVTPLKLPARK